MPARIPDHKRAAILADIRAGEPRNHIAREHGVALGTVTNIARENNVADAFDRTAVKHATAARIADQRAQRAATSQRFLDETNQLLDELHQPHLVFAFGGRENSYNEHWLPEPPTADKRNLMVSAATAFDKHLKADAHDAETGAEGARSVLGALGAALSIAAGELGDPADEPNAGD